MSGCCWACSPPACAGKASGGEAGSIERFAGENRYALTLLEDAYVDVRYSAREFTEVEARSALELASRLIKLLEGVERSVRLGEA